MSNRILDISKSESMLQLAKYVFPSLNDSTDDSFNESLGQTDSLLDTTSTPENQNELFNNNIRNLESIPGPLRTRGAQINTPLMSHPLCIQTSAAKQHPCPITTSPDIFSPHPGLLRESTADWPPLMLRPILVNNKPYYVMGELGKGATSVVQRAVDINWRFYALKSINLEDADQLLLDCYQNEISILLNLKEHSNVIHLFDFEYSLSNKKLHLVMECGQLDLARIIKDNNNKPFETYHIQTFWHDMLSGVTAIHSMDIVHTDLKPNNFVLVDTKLKLIDFGIACSLNDDATSFEREGRWGTPNYMAPEMILSTPKNDSLSSQDSVCKISQSADIWSLGCILYKLTYGITPFQRITDKIKKFIAITDPNEVISFQDDIPDSLFQVLVSCLDRNPRKRPTGLQLLSNKFLTC